MMPLSCSRLARSEDNPLQTPHFHTNACALIWNQLSWLPGSSEDPLRTSSIFPPPPCCYRVPTLRFPTFPAPRDEKM